MKFQKIMQTQLVIAGLATVLLFPGVTKGQEITNTPFDDGPNAAPFAQPVPAQGAGNSLSTLPRATSAIDGPVAAQQTTDEQKRSAVLIWIGATLVWIGAIGLYARGPTKRLTRALRSLRDSHSSAPGN
jgi:hypothetical protein